MTYNIVKKVLSALDLLENTLFEDPNILRAINLISDYDTGTYKLENSKLFISGFYELNLLLNISEAPLEMKKVLGYHGNDKLDKG